MVAGELFGHFLPGFATRGVLQNIVAGVPRQKLGPSKSEAACGDVCGSQTLGLDDGWKGREER